MSLEKKVQEVLRQYYYDHHDKLKMQADLVGLIESEKHDFLTKLIGHVDSRIQDCIGVSFPVVGELKEMRVYLKRQRGDKNEPPPSTL